ncbi:MAG: hypothetical protein ACHQLA_08820 [Ignavibacteriales bacterium]
MKTFNQKLQNLLKLFVLTAGILSFAACSEESDPIQPEITNLSGKWSGSLDHPGYDFGTLTLQILQTDNAISGSFTLILKKGNLVSNYGGSIDGAKTGANNYSISLINTNFTWITTLSQNSNSLNGIWESISNSLSGSVSLQKN